MNLAAEVVLITQGAMDMVAWIRSRIDKTYVLKKLDKVGAENKYRLDVYSGFQPTGKEQKKTT